MPVQQFGLNAIIVLSGKIQNGVQITLFTQSNKERYDIFEVYEWEFIASQLRLTLVTLYTQ